MINPNEASKYINAYLNRNGYTSVFKVSPTTLLIENRRETRPTANAKKYGKIPFCRNANGTVSYDLLDIQAFCEERLKPICENELTKKLAKASGAKYYLPYATPADELPPTMELGAWLEKLCDKIKAEAA